MRQRYDYDCGPAALKTLLDMQGYPDWDLVKLTELCMTTKQDGTSHQGIIEALRKLSVLYIAENETRAAWEVPRPFLANIYLPAEDDGHYVVVLRRYRSGVPGRRGSRCNVFEVWDPECGLREIEIGDFMKNWYSKRYGKQWFLCVVPW